MGPPGADQHPAGSSRAPPLFLLSTPSAYPIQTNKPPRRVRHPITAVAAIFAALDMATERRRAALLYG